MSSSRKIIKTFGVSKTQKQGFYALVSKHVGQVFRRYMFRILAEVAMIMKSTKLKVRANCMKRVFVECVATVDRGHERWLKCFSTALSHVLRLSVEVRASWLIRLESCEG